MIFKYINIPAFIISLAIGIFFVYVNTSDKREIFVYPTPETVYLLQYRDSAGNCFYFNQKKVTCPAKQSEISQIQPQS